MIEHEHQMLYFEGNGSMLKDLNGIRLKNDLQDFICPPRARMTKNDENE